MNNSYIIIELFYLLYFILLYSIYFILFHIILYYFILIYYNYDNLVDSASSHTLVSKIKPCMSKYKQNTLFK